MLSSCQEMTEPSGVKGIWIFFFGRLLIFFNQLFVWSFCAPLPSFLFGVVRSFSLCSILSEGQFLDHGLLQRKIGKKNGPLYRPISSLGSFGRTPNSFSPFTDFFLPSRVHCQLLRNNLTNQISNILKNLSGMFSSKFLTAFLQNNSWCWPGSTKLQVRKLLVIAFW